MRTLLVLFLAAIGINWPELSYNARVADALFIPLAIAVLMLPRTRWTWQWTDLAVAAYVIGALPSFAVSSDQRQSTIELGRELYLVAIYVIFAIAARNGFARVTGKGLALGAGVLSILGLGVLAIETIGGAQWPLIGEVMPLPYIGSTLRLRALTATPAMFACLLTAAAPFAITLCRERERVWCVAAIAMTVASPFTFSHVLAGFAVTVLITEWPALEPWPWLRRLGVISVAVVIVAFNFAAAVSITSYSNGGANYADSTPYQYAVDHRELRIGGATIAYNVMSYARIKQVAWRAFTEHPIAGVGLDQFHKETTRAFNEGRLTHTYREIDPHSTLLGRLAECGILGGVSLLLLWAAWIVMARDVGRSTVEPALGYAALAAIAGLIVASINADIMNFRFLWVIAGVLRGLYEDRGRASFNSNKPHSSAGTSTG